MQRQCRQLEEILGAFLQFARVGELELVGIPHREHRLKRSLEKTPWRVRATPCS